MTSPVAFLAVLRSRLPAWFGFGAPLPPLPVDGLDRGIAATLRTLRGKHRRDPALFRQGLMLHRQGKSRARLNAMFDAVTHYEWDIWIGPCDVSSPEERRVREKVLIALMLDDCRSSMAQHPCLLAYVLGDEG